MPNTEFILPKGVTGLSDADALPEESFTRFKSACHEVARRSKGRAGKFTSAGVTPNFHHGKITVESEVFSVVCNPKFKLIAFASPENEAKLQFLDHSEFQKSFKLQGFSVLSSAVLEESLNAANCAELTEAEMRELQYWRCRTVGEVVFNWFD